MAKKKNAQSSKTVQEVLRQPQPRLVQHPNVAPHRGLGLPPRPNAPYLGNPKPSPTPPSGGSTFLPGQYPSPLGPNPYLPGLRSFPPGQYPLPLGPVNPYLLDPGSFPAGQSGTFPGSKGIFPTQYHSLTSSNGNSYYNGVSPGGSIAAPTWNFPGAIQNEDFTAAEGQALVNEARNTVLPSVGDNSFQPQLSTIASKKIALPAIKVRGVRRKRLLPDGHNNLKSSNMRISTYGNLQELRKAHQARRCHKLETRKLALSSSITLTLHSAIFVKLWPKLGGDGNRFYRDTQDRSPMVREMLQTEPFAGLVEMAIKTDLARFNNINCVVTLLLEYLDQQLYCSATARQLYFHEEIHAIYQVIGFENDYENSEERPQCDMPVRCQNNILLRAVEVVEDRYQMYLLETRWLEMKRAETDQPGTLELCCDTLFSEEMEDPAFFSADIRALQPKSIKMRNTVTHKNLIAVSLMIIYLDIISNILKKFRELPNQAYVDFPQEAHITRACMWLNTWLVESRKSKAIFHQKLADQFATLPSESANMAMGAQVQETRDKMALKNLNDQCLERQLEADILSDKITALFNDKSVKDYSWGTTEAVSLTESNSPKENDTLAAHASPTESKNAVNDHDISQHKLQPSNIEVSFDAQEVSQHSQQFSNTVNITTFAESGAERKSEPLIESQSLSQQPESKSESLLEPQSLSESEPESKSEPPLEPQSSIEVTNLRSEVAELKETVTASIKEAEALAAIRQKQILALNETIKSLNDRLELVKDSPAPFLFAPCASEASDPAEKFSSSMILTTVDEKPIAPTIEFEFAELEKRCAAELSIKCDAAAAMMSPETFATFSQSIKKAETTSDSQSLNESEPESKSEPPLEPESTSESQSQESESLISSEYSIILKSPTAFDSPPGLGQNLPENWLSRGYKFVTSLFATERGDGKPGIKRTREDSDEGDEPARKKFRRGDERGRNLDF